MLSRALASASTLYHEHFIYNLPRKHFKCPCQLLEPKWHWPRRLLRLLFPLTSSPRRCHGRLSTSDSAAYDESRLIACQSIEVRLRRLARLLPAS